MKHRPATSTFATSCALIAGVLLSSGAVAAETRIQAFSSWEAKGQIYPTAPEEMTFVGSLFGVFYVQGDDGSFDAGLITCPSTIEMSTTDGSLEGNGKCVIITPDAERVYAAFQCEGAYGKGCNGEFMLTGGTGSKSGITGGGPVQFKSAFSDLTVRPGSHIEQESVGMAYWPALTYSLPASQ